MAEKDIVERLNKAVIMAGGSSEQRALYGLCQDARGEIVRLRTIAERLADALSVIESHYFPSMSAEAVLAFMRQTARTALSEYHHFTEPAPRLMCCLVRYFGCHKRAAHRG